MMWVCWTFQESLIWTVWLLWQGETEITVPLRKKSNNFVLYIILKLTQLLLTIWKLLNEKNNLIDEFLQAMSRFKVNNKASLQSRFPPE